MDQDSDDMPRRAPQEWIDALERGRADIAAGRTVPLATVLANLQASLDRMEARQAEQTPSAMKA